MREDFSDNPGSGARVLVVDDEPVILMVARRILEAEGYRVETFSDALEGRDRIERGARDFDAIMLDLRMPGPFDGYALASRILEVHPGLSAKLIVMSGDRLSEDYEAITKAPGVTVLPKPFATEELLRVVSAVSETAD